MVARLARTIAGALLGGVLGFGVGLGIVVYEARFENRFLESTNDIMGGRTVPIPVGLVVGGISGWSAPAFLVGGSAGALAGGVVGAVIGAVVGDVVSDARSGPWAGGVMGSALGIPVGVLVGLLMAQARRRRRGPLRVRTLHPGSSAVTIVLVLTGILAACGGGDPTTLPEVSPAPPAEGDDVESVLFFFGDPGKARYLKFPILPKLAQEVEQWSGRLEGDSSVVVVVLGDMIYPDGMHDPGDPGYATDSARIQSQIHVVRGEEARSRGARMYFVAGNHDWGLMEDRVGSRHLKNLGTFVDGAREQGGVHVDLVPDAGTGMPYVVDLGGIRLVLLDTAWWIFDAEPHRKQEMLDRLAEALATAGEREVIIAAHHPYETAGPHGGEATVWKSLGIRYLLARSGAMLQSLDSRIYNDLHAGLESIFARVERPLAFIGGHEHSLQVIRHDSATAPHFSLVSGSASKLTPVGWVPGMLYRRSAPGYMQLLVRQSGAIDLYIKAAPDRYILCPEDSSAEMEWEVCMEEGIDSYETVFSMRLQKAPAS